MGYVPPFQMPAVPMMTMYTPQSTTTTVITETTVSLDKF
jgi:hypothetical protein